MLIANGSHTVVKPSTGVITPETIQLADMLPAGGAQQWLDGIKNVVVTPGQAIIIPNLYACNSISLRTYYDDTDWGNGTAGISDRLYLDKTVEPTGALPQYESNGPILGLRAL